MHNIDLFDQPLPSFLAKPCFKIFKKPFDLGQVERRIEVLRNTGLGRLESRE